MSKESKIIVPDKKLLSFPNPNPERSYCIQFEIPEFTCVCPKTGQPDFATMRIEYFPAARCLELKSLKLYFWAFRQEGHFHESVCNIILNDLVNSVKPHYVILEGEFNVRGGIYTTIVVDHGERPDQGTIEPATAH